MLWATVFFTGKGWLAPAIGLALLALLVVGWSYRQSLSEKWVSRVCLTLKLLAFLALAACLLNPLWTAQRPKPGANLFLVLADNSQGLLIKDRDQSLSRGEQLKALLQADPAGWQERLEEQFQIRRFLFDSRMQMARDFNGLDFQGRYSSLGHALKTVKRRFEGRPVAGVLLFTDGNATDLPEGWGDTAGLPPVYPVLIGTGDVTKDLAIRKVTTSQTAFEDAPVTLQAVVSAQGYEGREITAQLTELESTSSLTGTAPTNPPAPGQPPALAPSSGRIAETQTLTAGSSADPLNFRFQFRPFRSGVSFYQLRVAARDEFDLLTQPDQSPEATLANNQRTILVDRGQGPYRILYVAGRPNWEYKFLNRALAEDDQVQLVGLIRVARREPKFVFKGRQGETSNPLFRGFDKKDEETEQYDQPVLIRLNTRDEFELKGGFPITEEELYEYHAVVLDDLDAGFFTQDQQSLLLRFVSERGGGFLMLGGPDSYRSGQYQKTALANLMPVYLDVPELEESPENLRLSLTREGWLQPWARLRTNEPEERFRLGEMPGFLSLNRADHIKPGATAIAMVRDQRNRQFPALVAQRYGRGRSSALLIGDYWRWGFREASMQRDLAKSWRQMARWLVADVPARTSLHVSALPEDPNQSVLIQTRVLDPSFLPVDNASVKVTVTPVLPDRQPLAGPNTDSSSTAEPASAGAVDQATPAPTALHLTGESSSQEAGLFETIYVPRQTGGYLIETEARDAQGVVLGQAEAGWTADAAAAEFQSLQPNLALLETVASATKGEMVPADRLKGFVEGLSAKEAPIQETWTRPLWHHPAVFLFALACLAAEWGLRRRKGLA